MTRGTPPGCPLDLSRTGSPGIYLLRAECPFLERHCSKREIATIKFKASRGTVSWLCWELGQTRVRRRGEDRAHTRSRCRSQLTLPGRNRYRSSGFQLLSAYLQGQRDLYFSTKKPPALDSPRFPLPPHPTLTIEGEIGV